MLSRRPLRIVTLNTWKNDGPYAARLPVMAEGLRALGADVILLQEVFRIEGGIAHTAEALARSLGFEYAYLPARAKERLWAGRAMQSESGLAVLARGPITRVERLDLLSDDEGGERLALLADVQFDQTAILVACTHLSHVRGDDARRREQLETVLAHPRWLEPGKVRVLGGDFNATADSAALNWLGDHPRLKIMSALATLPGVQATHPLPPREGRTGRAIDFLFSVSPREARAAEITAAGIALDVPSGGVWASDHAAVFMDLLPVSDDETERRA